MSDTTGIVVLFFKEIVRLNGFPKRITSDKDTNFMGDFYSTLRENIDKKLQFISLYHQNTNGETEVVNKTVGNLLRHIIVV